MSAIWPLRRFGASDLDKSLREPPYLEVHRSVVSTPEQMGELSRREFVVGSRSESG